MLLTTSSRNNVQFGGTTCAQAVLLIGMLNGFLFNTGAALKNHCLIDVFTCFFCCIFAPIQGFWYVYILLSIYCLFVMYFCISINLLIHLFIYFIYNCSLLIHYFNLLAILQIDNHTYSYDSYTMDLAVSKKYTGFFKSIDQSSSIIF